MPLRATGLRARIVAASVLLGVVFAGAFVLLVFSAENLRASARDARHSEQVVALANQLQKLVLDLETGQRGYVITGQSRFLDPYRDAVAQIPSTIDRLSGLVAKDPVQRVRVAVIAHHIDEYEVGWARRVLGIARRNLPAARAFVANGGGKRRVDLLRREFSTFLTRQQELSTAGGSAADSEGRQAIELGIFGVAGSALLILVYASFLLRLVSLPVQRVAAGARRLARGDLSTRVPERGVAEIGQLARDFNAMASSLEAQRAQLAQQNAELQAVLDATIDGICVTDPSGELLFANRKMDRFWAEVGLGDEGTIWDRLARLARKTTTPDDYYKVFERLAADPLHEVGREFVLAGDGRTFVGHTAPVTNSGGKLVGRIFTARDVTVERRAEQMKDDFVATVSHELRTPLTSIVGYAELVLDPDAGVGTLEPMQRQFLEVVHRNAKRLHRLVGDLLFFAQVEAGRLQVERLPVDVVELAERTLEVARPVADERGVTLELDASAPAAVAGDSAKLEQMLDNLMSNAVKFTPPGGRVSLGVHRDGDDVAITVQDTGIGIAPDELDQLFERFFRASSATSREIPGTGLGLAIAKTIAEAHDGRIEVRSVLGKGTRFAVLLPAASVDEPARVLDAAAKA
jgi:signal transduction histidine kinase/CHASE3 domain sensor protein